MKAQIEIYGNCWIYWNSFEDIYSAVFYQGLPLEDNVAANRNWHMPHLKLRQSWEQLININ